MEEFCSKPGSMITLEISTLSCKSLTLSMNQPDPNANKTNADATTEPVLQSEADAIAPPTIRLDQFLQLCGVATGGQAKILIQSGQVLLNGEVETRRRKKLALGDEVVLDGEIYEVAFESESDDAE